MCYVPAATDWVAKDNFTVEMVRWTIKVNLFYFIITGACLWCMQPRNNNVVWLIQGVAGKGVNTEERCGPTERHH